MYSDRSVHNNWVEVVQLDNCGVFCINTWCADAYLVCRIWCADSYLMAISDQQCWPMRKTLPEAQRTQGIKSITWIISPTDINLKLVEPKDICQVTDSIPWVRCAFGNVLYLPWYFLMCFLWVCFFPFYVNWPGSLYTYVFHCGSFYMK